MNSIADMACVSEQPNFDSLGDAPLVANFLRHQRGRAFSNKTIKRRRSVLLRFISHLEPLRLSEASPDLVEDWLHRFRSAATKHAYRSDLIAFYEWAIKRKISLVNPASDTDTIRCPKTLPRPLDTRDVPRIIESASAPLDLWCALAAYGGLRCSEIANLSREDVTLHGSNPTIAIRGGKGRKDRVIPLHPTLGEMFKAYNLAGPMFDKTGEQVGRQGSAHIRSLGINGTMHQLRHTFGTELARASSGNVVLVAYLMGHASTTTTMGYIGWQGGRSTEIVATMYSDKPLAS